MGEHGKDVLDVQTEAADEVNSAFPEGQTVVGAAVEGASSFHFVGFVVVGVVEEAVEAMYFLGSGSGGGPGVALEVVDIEEGTVDSKAAVTGAAWVEK